MKLVKKLVILIMLQVFCFSALPKDLIESIIHEQNINNNTKLIDGSVYYNNRYALTFMGISQNGNKIFNITIYNISFKMNKIGYGTCRITETGYELNFFITMPSKYLKYFNTINLTK